MVKMIIVLFFGVAMFVASAAGSWYLQNKVLATHAPAGAAPAADPHAAPAADAHGATPPATASAHAAGDHGSPLQTSAPAATPGQGERLPVAIRPRDMSVEELLRYSMGVKEREEKVKQNEELLQKRRVQQQLALADIEGERREIDGLRVQISEQLKHAQTLIEKLNEVRTEFSQEKDAASQSLQQMKHERIAIDEEHMDNTKRLSQWIQGMDPEKAADVLTSMANDGDEQLEIAVQILRNLEEREAAKILSAIDDTKLVQMLIEKFRHLQKPPAKTAARK
ncbi:MotE family protein [Planctomicrobium piriforme]|uniref:Flagellar motility protein MotE, a chaperone for MotC folding n=1 Tax=Planctomicrobium piriforme TaxID=1576369 RepID=A0A1I3GRW1_9PLAN|nr:hypothetical protein [Planctomicrobium piriforme]SFI26157.1 hypothetical protein SAMN05421753_107104 [Planctomicrobium piriforme]